jgi:hypothetical protein
MFRFLTFASSSSIAAGALSGPHDRAARGQIPLAMTI